MLAPSIKMFALVTKKKRKGIKRVYSKNIVLELEKKRTFKLIL